MAGYVTRHDDLSEDDLLEVTMFYFQKYGSFTSSLDRGGMKVPTDKAGRLAFFSFILFNTVEDKFCRKSLTNLLVLVSQMHTFNMTRKHALTLSNIFFNNHCKQMTPCLRKETKGFKIK